MRDNYGIIAHHNRIRKFLKNVRMEIIVKNNKCPIPEGLEELRENKIKLAPQRPPNH